MNSVWLEAVLSFRSCHWKRLSVMQPFMNLGSLRLQTGIKPHKCLFFPMLAVIRIARGSVATDAFSQRSLWIFKKTSCVFSLRSEQGAELHKSDDRFCWFSFQGVQIDGGVSVGAVLAPNRWLHKHWAHRPTTCAYAQLCAAKSVPLSLRRFCLVLWVLF